MKSSNTDKSKLNALILIGGQSKRMGNDKSILKYHGIPQWKYLYNILDKLVDTVYVSVRPNQKFNFPNLITDKVVGLGPFGAILTALETKPNEAFLVVATDLPFIDKKTIESLIKNRDTSKGATALQAKSKEYPEPLVTIWEPKSLATLQSFYKNKIYKLIQVLKSIPIKKIVVADQIVKNINTEMEYHKVLKKLNLK